MLYDCYQGLTHWMTALTSADTSSSTSRDDPIIHTSMSSASVVRELMARSSPQLTPYSYLLTPATTATATSNTRDHTDVFKNTLLKLNAVSREQSTRRATSVKVSFNLSVLFCNII